LEYKEKLKVTYSFDPFTLTPSLDRPSWMEGSSLSALLPFVDLSAMTTWEMDWPYLPNGSSVSSTASSVTLLIPGFVGQLHVRNVLLECQSVLPLS